MTPLGALRLLLAASALAVALAAPAGAQTATSFGNAAGALRLPEAVAVAPDGTVLVGDHFSGRIQPFRDGRPVDGAFGLRGKTCGRLGAVGGLAVAPDGRAFVLDSDNQRVHVFDAGGKVIGCFGRRGFGRGQFRTGSGAYAASTASGGIAVSGRHLYVADTGNDRVQRFTLDGGSPKVIGKGRLDDPQGLAVRGGRLLVADDRNHRVVEFTTGGRFVRAAKAGLRFPYDVAIAPGGRAFVADNNGHRIVVLDRRLRPVRAWGRYGRGRGQLIFPRAVAMTPRGTVVVADAGNDRMKEFTASGRLVRTFGTSGRRNGMLTAPQDVAVNARGEVVVADGNLRLSWHDLTGRFLGRWAQGRSFRQSTAVVSGPRSVAFASDSALHVVDSGTAREFAPGVARSLLSGEAGGIDGPFARAVDRDAAGTTWMLDGAGRFAPVRAGGTLGPALGDRDEPDRASTALAFLSDGSVAIARGAADNRANPADGEVVRFDAAGRRLSSWRLARPPGGEATKPAGVASDGAGGVWVSDAANARVLHLSAAGDVLTTLGTAGAGPGELARPTGLALDCAGGLLVADTGNNRVVRFPGVQATRGCAAPSSPRTAAARMPRPVGVRLRVRERARGPQARLATVSVLCDRPCRVRARAVLSPYARGRVPRAIPLRTRVTGRRIVVTGGDRAVRALRSVLRARGGSAAVSVTVEASGSGGVVDVATTTMSFR